MPSGARLWWVQHGSPQGIAQETAACTWPCETGRRCSSSGGIIVDSGSTVSENQQEAETVFSQSLCTTASASSGSFNPGASSGGSNSGTFVPQPSIMGGSSGGTVTGTFNPGAGSGTFPSAGTSGAGTTGGAGNFQGGSSPNVDGKFIDI
jgi:hypothetical protein